METWQICLDLGELPEGRFDKSPEEFIARRLSESPTGDKITRAFLNSGILVGDIIEEPGEGTPQGGPLSPLLSNIVLDELDKELEKRGLHFVRYADDCVIYVKSKRAGERVMQSVTRFITGKLKLVVNEAKSSVTRPWASRYLGYTIWQIMGKTQIGIHPRSLKRFKDNIRTHTARSKGRSVNQVIVAINNYARGWWNYFRTGGTKTLTILIYAVGVRILIPRNSTRSSRCLSPLIIKVDLASTAHSRILLSSGSSVMTLILTIGLIMSQAACNSSRTLKDCSGENLNFGRCKTSRSSSRMARDREQPTVPLITSLSASLGGPPKRIADIKTFVSRTIL